MYKRGRIKILHKSNKITLRTVTKADKDIYLDIEQENSIILSPLFRINQEYGFAALKDVFNTLCQENCISCAIVDNENNIVIGFCQIEGIGKEEQSIGITIDKKFQRKGYGY